MRTSVLRSIEVSSGRLRKIKNKLKFQTCSSKSGRGGRLQEGNSQRGIGEWE